MHFALHILCAVSCKCKNLGAIQTCSVLESVIRNTTNNTNDGIHWSPLHDDTVNKHAALRARIYRNVSSLIHMSSWLTLIHLLHLFTKGKPKQLKLGPYIHLR